MRCFILTLLISFSITAAQSALASDEFGERFAGETPVGMAEGTYEPEEVPPIAMDNEAIRLQDIVPAAGDENESPEETSTDASQEDETLPEDPAE